MPLPTDASGNIDWLAAGKSQLEQDSAEKLRLGMSTALPSNPDTEAQLRRYASAAGVPVETARNQPDQIKLQAQMAGFDAQGVARDFPATGAWLADTENARLAHDDVHPLTQVEKAVRALSQPATPPASEQGAKTRAAQSVGVWDYLTGAGDDSLLDDSVRAAKTVSNKIGFAGSLALSTPLRLLDATGLTSTLGDTALGWAKQYDEAATAAEGGAQEFHNKLVRSAASLGLQLPMMMATGGGSALPEAGASIMATLGAATVHGAKSMAIPAMSDAIQTMSRVYAATGDIGAAAKAGEAQYVNSTAMGILPLSAPGKLLARMGGGAVVGAVQGEASRVLMNTALPDQMAQQFDWENIALNAVTSSLMAGGMGPRAEPQRAAAVKAFNEAYDHAMVQAQSEQIAGLAQAATTSKLRERDPAAFKQLVANMADRGDIPTDINIDANRLTEVLDAHGVTGDELMQTMPEVARQLQDALAPDAPTNALIRIPVEDFATHIAGSELEKPVMEHLRVGEQSRTVAEAKAFKETQEAEMTARAGEIDAAHVDDADYQASLAKMNEQIDQNLAGLQMRPDQLATNSALLRAFYQVQADRLGIKPDEFAARYPLNGVNRALGGDSLEQGPQYPMAPRDEWHGEGTYKENGGRIVYVTPDEYLAAVRQLTMDAESRENIDLLKEHIQAGKTLDPLLIRADGKEDGRHRAYAAKELGINRVPVIAYGDKFSDAPTTLNQSTPQTQTPEFKAWFGDSKVVDAEGQPLVVYHGTTADFDVFDVSEDKRGVGGIWFSDSKNYAHDMAKGGGWDNRNTHTQGKVISVYIKASNPKVFDVMAEARKVAEEIGVEPPSDTLEAQELLAGGIGWDAVVSDVVRESKQQGHDALIVKNFNDGRVVDSTAYVAFDPTQIKSAIGNNGQFDPNNPSILRQSPNGPQARGTYSPSTKTIALLKGANLSTFQHELGHYFLDTLTHMADMPDAPASVKADVAELFKWGGVTDLQDWHTRTVDQQRELHEKFATAWETYLMKGEAPSLEMRGLFSRFRSWMVSVYKNLKGAPGDFTPEVRGVMDRLIASEDAIKEAEAARKYMPLFSDPEKASMTPEDWAAYQAQGKDATEVAIEELTGKTLRDLARIDRLRASALKSVQEDAAQKYKAIERETRAEVMSQPVYRAWSYLTASLKGDLPDADKALHAQALKSYTTKRDAFESDLMEKVKAEGWAAAPESKTPQKNGLAKGLWMARNRKRLDLEVQRQMLDYDQANPKPVAPERPAIEDDTADTGAGRLDYGSVIDVAGPQDANTLRAMKMTLGKSSRVSVNGPIDPAKDSLLVAVAKLGGVDRETARRDLGVPADDLKTDVGLFGKNPFRKSGGQSAESMIEALIEHHYLMPGDGLHELEQALQDELSGSPRYSMAHQFDSSEPMAEGAMHPDLVGEMFGFNSGSELVRSLAGAEHPRDVIKGLSDQRMLERHGEIATPQDMARAADMAVHNEVRAQFIASELKALKKATGESKDIVQAAKEAAQRTVDGQRVQDIRAGRYNAAATRAARDAERLMAKGDTAGAAMSKRDQLLSLELARASLDAREFADKAAEYLRKFDTAAIRKSVDPDYVDQIQTLLERFDLRSQSGTAIDRKNNLRTWVQSRLNAGEMPLISESLLSAKERVAYEKQINSRDEDGNLVYPDDDERIKLLADAIEASAQRSYKDLTLSELRGLVDTVKNIEHLGRMKDKLLTAKDAASFSERRDLLTVTLKDNAKNSGKNVRTDNTWIGKRLDGLKQFGVSHIKPATWAQRFDGGPGNGPWWSTIIRPANERAAWETSQRAAATERLMEIFKPVLPKVNYLDKIGKGKFIPEIGTSLNWEERFAIACNYGNESNLQRLMGGGIAGTTKRLTMEQVQAVLRTLSADEWHAVQGVWDHFETYRPEIAAKERRISGIEPQWIEARAFSVKTSDGQTLDLRGGYFPVVYDPKTSLKAEQHADSQAAKDAMKAAYSAATTQRSFTKARVEEVTDRPLLLNLRGLYSGVNDVIHDLAWHEWVIDMNRFMRSTQIDEAMREHYGPNVKREFTKWRDDIVAGSKRLDHGVENAAGWARKFVSASALTYNVMSAIMQPLGITLSFARVGTRWVGQGLAEYVGNPVAATRSVREQSEFMRNRSRTLFRDLNELRNQVGGQTTGRELMGRYGYFLTMQMQMTVDVPTWIGARNKALSEGHDDATAVALADQAVKDSQGGGEEVDQAGITRGGPLVKLFTAFYDFMNTQANTLYLSGTTSKSRAEAFWHFAMVGVLTPVLAKALKDAITPGDSGNWDDWQSTVKTMVSEGLQNLIGMVAFGREFSTVAKKLMGDSKGQGYSGPTGLRIIPDSAKLAEQAAQGEFDDAFRKAALNWAGDVSGIPAVQANRTITGFQALSEGKTSYPAAVVFGFQEPK